jgi:hypothetical protein
MLSKPRALSSLKTPIYKWGYELAEHGRIPQMFALSGSISEGINPSEVGEFAWLRDDWAGYVAIVSLHHSMRLYPFVVLLVGIVGGEFTSSQCHAASSGNGFHLDGKGPIIETRTTSALELTREVTLEAWVLPGQYSEAGVRLIDKSEAGTQSGYMLDTFPGNSLRMVLAEGLLTARGVLEPGYWAHVVRSRQVGSFADQS